MRNYIILNGNNSNEIAGLLIQKLPPISQPEIRTNIEEIDGRDGDIITKLGYSAYNKEISIGLYGNYNVDDVIAYFTNNQNGQITFSNEPDKYYNYEILEQIDYEKLIRYRTATITLHCQPFKYSTTEEKIQINATEVSGSGSSITLNNTEDGAMFTNLQINGDTSQDGTPTPSNPVNVDVVTGDNTITISNKNLCYKTELQGVQNIRFYFKKVAQSNIAVSFTPNVDLNNNSLYLRVDGTDLGLAGTITGTANTKVSRVLTLSTTQLNAIKNGNEIYLLLYKNGANFVAPTDAQIEVSSTVTDYIEHEEQDYTISLGNIELCKIGDYQDYIYKNNDKWYLHKEIGKVDLGTLTWNSASADTSGFRRYYTNTIPNIKYVSANTEIGSALAEKYSIARGRGISATTNTLAIDVSIVSVIDLQANNNPTGLLYYALNTSTETEITDTTLLSQLEALEGATTYLGETNINTSGSDLSPLLDVTTYSVDNPSFTITNSGNIYSKPIITIYGIGTIGLYLNGIQVLSLDMGETTSQITIDVAKLEAYNQETGALMNRNVTGDYNNLVLNVGENTITESGTLQGLEVENYSRWL